MSRWQALATGTHHGACCGRSRFGGAASVRPISSTAPLLGSSGASGKKSTPRGLQRAVSVAGDCLPVELLAGLGDLFKRPLLTKRLFEKVGGLLVAEIVDERRGVAVGGYPVVFGLLSDRDVVPVEDLLIVLLRQRLAFTDERVHGLLFFGPWFLAEASNTSPRRSTWFWASSRCSENP